MTENGTTYIFAGGGHYVSGSGQRSSGGLFRRYAGEGDWQALTAGLPEKVEARAFAVHPREPGVIYAGTQDGPYRTTDGGERWERARLSRSRRGDLVARVPSDAAERHVRGRGAGRHLPQRGRRRHVEEAARSEIARPLRDGVSRRASCASSPIRRSPTSIYAGLEVSGVIRSTDGGETWTDLSAPLVKLSEQPHLKSRIGSDLDAEGMLDTHALAVSAAAPGTAFLAVRMGVFRTDDRGASWHDVEVGRYSPLTYCRDVIVSPHDPRVLYACLSVSSRGDDGSLYRSDDVGRTWRRFDHGVKSRATMMAVAAHPRDPARVYCVSRCGQVFGTEDAGAIVARVPAARGRAGRLHRRCRLKRRRRERRRFLHDPAGRRDSARRSDLRSAGRSARWLHGGARASGAEGRPPATPHTRATSSHIARPRRPATSSRPTAASFPGIGPSLRAQRPPRARQRDAATVRRFRVGRRRSVDARRTAAPVHRRPVGRRELLTCT